MPLHPLSPATTFYEVDRSATVQSPGVVPTAIVGYFRWGPVGLPTSIPNPAVLESVYGQASATNYRTWLVAEDFLVKNSSLVVGRAIDASTAKNAVAVDSEGNRQGLISLVVKNVAGSFEPGDILTIGNDAVDPSQDQLPVSTVNVISWDDNTNILHIDIGLGTIEDSPLTDFKSGYPIVATRGDNPAVVASAQIDVAIAGSVYIPNDDEADALVTGGVFANADVGIAPIFAARYPGKIGNSLGVVVIDSFADSVNFTTTGFKLSGIQTQLPPLTDAAATSSFAVDRNLAGCRDLFHVVVIDVRGELSGTAGTILETFPFVSKFADAIDASGTVLYWKDVINARSEYLWVLDNPTVASVPRVTAVADVVFTAEVELADTATNIPNPTSLNAVSDFVGVARLPDAATIKDGTIFLLTDQSAGTLPNGLYQWVGLNEAGDGYAKAITTANGDCVRIRATTPTKYYVKNNSGNWVSPVISVIAKETIVDSGAAVTNNNVQKFLGWGLNFSQSTFNPLQEAPMFGTIASSSDAVNAMCSVFTDGSDGLTDNPATDIPYVYDRYFDKADIEIRQLIVGGLEGNNDAQDHTTIVKAATAFAEKRKDVLVFHSPPAELMVGKSNKDRIVRDIVAWSTTTLNNISSYRFCDGGYYLRYNKFTGQRVWIPLAGATAGLSSDVDTNLYPWYSFAGYRRGLYPNVEALAYNPNQNDRDLLFPACVNPVVNEKGRGVVLLGDKTGIPTLSVFDNPQNRKTAIIIEQQIVSYAKNQMFEFNDDVSRITFVNAVTPFLAGIKSARGLDDFQVICDSSNNTPQVLANREFVGTIKLKFKSTTRWVTLGFVGVDQTVSFDQAVA